MKEFTLVYLSDEFKSFIPLSAKTPTSARRQAKAIIKTECWSLADCYIERTNPKSGFKSNVLI